MCTSLSFHFLPFIDTLHIIYYISTTLFLPLYFLPQYDTNSGPEATAEIKIKMIIHYENKLTNCQLAPQNSDIMDRQWSRRSLSRSLSFRSIHRYICEIWSQAPLASKTAKGPSPLLASGDDDVS